MPRQKGGLANDTTFPLCPARRGARSIKTNAGSGPLVSYGKELMVRLAFVSHYPTVHLLSESTFTIFSLHTRFSPNEELLIRFSLRPLYWDGIVWCCS